jgi:peptidyl-dipeptidase Dcp
VRRRLFEASLRRADHGGETDTRAIVQRLSQVRLERAALLGYPTVAAYALDDQMAKTPETAIKLLTDIAKVATVKARGEAAKIQALIDRGGGVPLEPWDWQYYAAKARRGVDIDEAQLKPYLELNRVRDGVLRRAPFLRPDVRGAARSSDVPRDVRVFEVRTKTGPRWGSFTPTTSARQQEWWRVMDSFIDQSELFARNPSSSTRPTSRNPLPAAGAAQLRRRDTLFHEFGHGP